MKNYKIKIEKGKELGSLDLLGLVLGNSGFAGF